MTNNFGTRVKEARDNLTQQQLADMLGVTMQYVQVVEYGKSLLSMDKLVLLCEATDKPPSFFLQDYLKTYDANSNSVLRDVINQFDDEQLTLLSVILDATKKNNDAEE